VSAGVSVVTGYVGTLLNFRRQRVRARRTYGLAILSEIKSLQRVFRRYHGILGSEPAAVQLERLPKLRLTSADLNVFGFNSGQVGLFSVRAAVEVIELYSRIREVMAQAQTLAALQETGAVVPEERAQALLFEHLEAVVLLRRQAHAVAGLLRKELPMTFHEVIRFGRRRGRIAVRRMRGSVHRRLARSRKAGTLPSGRPDTGELARGTYRRD
jgi:hypothetical protein